MIKDSDEIVMDQNHIKELVNHLESDDPVKNQIGISLLNRTEITSDGWLDWGSKLPLKTSYHLAKKAGIENSDHVIETLCKRLGNYNTEDVILQRLLKNDIETIWWALRSATVEALEHSITDEVVVEEQIIDGFNKDYHSLHNQLYRILCYIDKGLVNYLIEVLNDHSFGLAPGLNRTKTEAVLHVLGKIKVERFENSLRAAEILGEIANIRAVKPLAEMLQTSDERGAYYGENKINLIHAAAKKALEHIAEKNVEGEKKQNIMKFLKSDERGLVMMGAAMLKGILEE